MLEDAKSSKFDPLLSENNFLHPPWATQNRPKINEKSFPREHYFHIHFQHPFKSPPGALPGHLKIIF